MTSNTEKLLVEFVEAARASVTNFNAHEFKLSDRADKTARKRFKQLQDAGAEGRVASIMHDPDPSVRLAASSCVLHMGGESSRGDAIKVLEELGSDSSPPGHIRASAFTTLTAWKDLHDRAA